MSSATTLPDGYQAPAALLDASHHGAWVHITNGFGLVVILISLAIRTYIRIKVSPPFKYDDIALAGATALCVIQAGLVFAQVSAGFGTSIDLLGDGAIVKIEKLGYAADVMYFFTIYTSKASVVMLFARISVIQTHKTIARSILVLCVLFGLVSLLLCALRCDLNHPWKSFGEHCSSLEAQATAVAAFDILTELMLFSISVMLVWDLQTAVMNKCRVVLAFGIRFPVITVIILRLISIRHLQHSTNPTLDGALTAIFTQVEIFYGLMAATVPCLRPFLAGFSTNYGAMNQTTVIGGSQIGMQSQDTSAAPKGNSFIMSPVTSKERPSRLSMLKGKISQAARRDTGTSISNETFRPDQTGTETQVRGGYDSRSIGSQASTKMIIKKQMHFHVDSENENEGDRSARACRDCGSCIP